MDVNVLAAAIVAEAVQDRKLVEATTGKNPAAVALGRLGGLKGGKARAARLTARHRKDIARNAALARWGTEASA